MSFSYLLRRPFVLSFDKNKSICTPFTKKNFVKVMTSFNSYLDAIKPLAKSFKEKAAKFSDAVDGSLKKTQENIEK